MKYELQAFQFAFNMKEKKSNFAITLLKLQKAIKSEEIKEEKN